MTCMPTVCTRAAPPWSSDWSQGWTTLAEGSNTMFYYWDVTFYQWIGCSNSV